MNIEKLSQQIEIENILNKSFEEKLQLLNHVSAGTLIFKALSKDENWRVRIVVAKNQNTDPETLKLLAKDKDWSVRQAVAGNPNTDCETLKKLAEDENCWVCEAVDERFLKRNKFKFFELMLYQNIY